MVSIPQHKPERKLGYNRIGKIKSDLRSVIRLRQSRGQSVDNILVELNNPFTNPVRAGRAINFTFEEWQAIGLIEGRYLSDIKPIDASRADRKGYLVEVHRPIKAAVLQRGVNCGKATATLFA
jgi:hypothetical protein